MEENPLGKRVVLAQAKNHVMTHTKGMCPAPMRILEVVDKGAFEAGARGLGDVLNRPESPGLRHLCAAITYLKKDEGPGTDIVKARPYARVGMRGAGLMGAGTATDLADIKDCAGFYTTRGLVPYMAEAIFLALDGYQLADIDEAAAKVGFPVGPITLTDEVSIDVGIQVLDSMKHYYGDRTQLPPDVSSALME